MKAFSTAGFSIAAKYARISDLLMAYVWHLDGPEPPVTYALTYAEVRTVADAMGWIETSSFKDGGSYTTTKPSEQLKTLIEPFRVIPGRWWKLVVGAEKSQPPT